MSTAPILNFTSISGGVVSAEYLNLPANSRIVFVDKTSNQSYEGLGAAGGRAVMIAVPAGMPGGEYYLRAEDSSGNYLAQSVPFYVPMDGGAE